MAPVTARRLHHRSCSSRTRLTVHDANTGLAASAPPAAMSTVAGASTHSASPGLPLAHDGLRALGKVVGCLAVLGAVADLLAQVTVGFLAVSGGAHHRDQVQARRVLIRCRLLRCLCRC